jgi:hypothetical protein
MFPSSRDVPLEAQMGLGSGNGLTFTRITLNRGEGPMWCPTWQHSPYSMNRWPGGGPETDRAGAQRTLRSLRRTAAQIGDARQEIRRQRLVISVALAGKTT